MAHRDNNPGDYPIPENQGFVIPADHTVEPHGDLSQGPQETIVGEEAIAILTQYAEELIRRNNLLTSHNVFFPDNAEHGAIAGESLYRSVIDTEEGINAGAKLKEVVALFEAIPNIESAITNALANAFEQKPYERQIRLDDSVGVEAARQYITNATHWATNEDRDPQTKYTPPDIILSENEERDLNRVYEQEDYTDIAHFETVERQHGAQQILTNALRTMRNAETAPDTNSLHHKNSDFPASDLAETIARVSQQSDFTTHINVETSEGVEAAFQHIKNALNTNENAKREVDTASIEQSLIINTRENEELSRVYEQNEFDTVIDNTKTTHQEVAFTFVKNAQNITDNANTNENTIEKVVETQRVVDVVDSIVKQTPFEDVSTIKDNAYSDSNPTQRHIKNAREHLKNTKHETDTKVFDISESALVNENIDVTRNDRYHKDVIGDFNARLGAEQTYHSERSFTESARGEWTSDIAEISGFGLSQIVAYGALGAIGPATAAAIGASLVAGGSGQITGPAAAATTGLFAATFGIASLWLGKGGATDFSEPMSNIFDNAIINFYGGLAREFKRYPSKLIKWVTNNAILKMQNPNVVNADFSATALAKANPNILDIVNSIRGDDSDGPVRANVASIYRRLGPSVASMIPDVDIFSDWFGKGKLFNPLSLAGGGSLTFGEQYIPGTGHALDGVVPFVGIVSPITIATSELRNKDELEPYSTIAQIENPQHFEDKKVLSRIGKNQWQLKNLPDNLIMRPTGLGITDFGTKPYKTDTSNDGVIKISSKDVRDIEAKLDAEYVPFYFHDLRTNEIVAFHAFIRSLTETFSPTWNSEQYYGRVDNVQIYAGNTRRDISLSFTVVALNRIDFDIMWKKMNKFVTLVYPQYGEAIKNNNEENIPFSEPLRGAPVIRLRIGDLIKTNFSMRAAGLTANEQLARQKLKKEVAGDTGNTAAGDALDKTNKKINMIKTLTANFKTFSKGLPGIINDITLDYGAARWETVRGHVAPQLIEVALSFTVIHDIPPGLDVNGVNRGPLYTPFRDIIDTGNASVTFGDAPFNNSLSQGTLDYTMNTSNATKNILKGL